MNNIKETLLAKQAELVELSKKVELDETDGAYALEASKEIYYGTLKGNATEKMLKAAEDARNIEINRILQERASQLESNNIGYKAQLELIDELLKLYE